MHLKVSHSSPSMPVYPVLFFLSCARLQNEPVNPDGSIIGAAISSHPPHSRGRGGRFRGRPRHIEPLADGSQPQRGFGRGRRHPRKKPDRALYIPKAMRTRPEGMRDEGFEVFGAEPRDFEMSEDNAHKMSKAVCADEDVPDVQRLPSHIASGMEYPEAKGPGAILRNAFESPRATSASPLEPLSSLGSECVPDPWKQEVPCSDQDVAISDGQCEDGSTPESLETSDLPVKQKSDAPLEESELVGVPEDRNKNIPGDLLEVSKTHPILNDPHPIGSESSAIPSLSECGTREVTDAALLKHCNDIAIKVDRNDAGACASEMEHNDVHPLSEQGPDDVATCQTNTDASPLETQDKSGADVSPLEHSWAELCSGLPEQSCPYAPLLEPPASPGPAYCTNLSDVEPQTHPCSNTSALDNVHTADLVVEDQERETMGGQQWPQLELSSGDRSMRSFTVEEKDNVLENDCCAELLQEVTVVSLVPERGVMANHGLVLFMCTFNNPWICTLPFSLSCASVPSHWFGTSPSVPFCVCKDSLFFFSKTLFSTKSYSI